MGFWLMWYVDYERKRRLEDGEEGLFDVPLISFEETKFDKWTTEHPLIGDIVSVLIGISIPLSGLLFYKIAWFLFNLKYK